MFCYLWSKVSLVWMGFFLCFGEEGGFFLMVCLWSFFFFVCLGANCVHVFICMILLVSIMLGINFVGLMLIEMTRHWEETLWVKTSICNHMKSISSCGTKILEYHISCTSINQLILFFQFSHIASILHQRMQINS